MFGREIFCILGLAGGKFKKKLTNPRYTCHTCIANPIKVMLSVRLDEETERQLADILAHEQTEKSELIRRLIAERWLTLQADKTLVERRGGHPEHLLQDAPTDLSERSNRKKAIAQYLNKRHS
ncbi:MAG: hypothetical protein V7K55_09405 [Nostoc sp.]